MEYESKRDANNAEQLRKSRNARDIAADYPRRGDMKRRAACERDLRLFLATCFPNAFAHAFCADHLRVIAKIQSAILDGGLFAVAMPRGSGKTTILLRSALWALLYGHRRFVCVVGATEKAAKVILGQLKSELLNNPLLGKDHRQACYPIRRLENKARRCVGQLFKGERTSIVWSAEQITFPTVPNASCDGVNVSGSTVTVASLEGALRGQSHTRVDGRVIRPDLVLLDDVQTRESAFSPSQTNDRLAVVQGDVLGLAGPGQRITAFAALTVVAPDDLADQLLNRDRNPQWAGERTKALYAWPTADDQWEQYRRLRREGQKRGDGTAEATDFYAANRAAMDAGAVVAWPERKYPEQVSALQHLIDMQEDIGADAFAAEYQNDPLRPQVEADGVLTADGVMGKLNGLVRGVVPTRASYLTAFVDCHDALLFWCVCGWSPGFTGWVVEYGAHPGQRRRAYTLRKASPTLADLAPGASKEGAIHAGLTSLTGSLLGREWPREGGGSMRIDRCLVDAGYVPDTVYDFCRRSPHTAVLLPSRGAGVGAASRPMSEYQERPGERHGHYWMTSPTANRTSRYGRFDTNYWTSFVHARLGLAIGDDGGLSLFGGDPEEHRLFAQHVVAEAPVLVTANGRTVAEWRMRPGVADNHLLDCLRGCAVAASMAGAAVEGLAPTPLKPSGRKRVSYAQMQAEARAGRGY